LCAEELLAKATQAAQIKSMTGLFGIYKDWTRWNSVGAAAGSHNDERQLINT